MKKILSHLFMVAFCTSAIAADGPVTASRTLPSATQAQVASATTAAVRTPIARTAATTTEVIDTAPVSTGAATAPTTTTVITGSPTPSRTATVSRVVSTGTTANVDSARGAATNVRSGVSRSTATTDTNSARAALESAVHTSGRSQRTAESSINNSPELRRAGITLRPSTAEVGGRATISGTGVQTGSNIGNTQARSVQTRAAATGVTARETIAEATERLRQTSDLNKSCQEQYNDCMDQFCAVIDANQKRCSCSANLSRYTKVETAVKDANTQLNEVAQRIRYVGLSADEIRAIMTATEAELVLSGTRDVSESRSMLDEIEKLIKDPTSTNSYSSDTFSSLDMDLDFSSSASDLFSLDFLTGNTSSSFSNLRGTELYNAAKKRCNSVLTQCKDAGATTAQITGNYDLAIDKDCIAYEAGLTKMNETLLTNVRSANLMLQKARLAVLQDKNQYDTKGCIAALNTCMEDDMVCGSDYTKCLDPTKKYIDENGKVVLGQRIADITDFMTNYNNAAIDRSYLASAKTANLSACKTSPNNDGRCIVRYLLEKIGTGKTVSDGGLCRAVLDKCQRVTYGGNNNVYDEYNEVVLNYVQRAMVNIQSAQKQVISNYASSCMVDIATCYNQQVSQVNAWSSSASVNSIYNVMRGACRNVALTCSYAVFEGNTALCPTDGSASSQDKCINSVSEMFYQSLLCPENSSYQTTAGTAGTNGYVNERCKCDTGYTIWGKTCTRTCTPGTYRNTLTGICDSCPAGTYWDSATETQACTTCPAATPNSPTGSTSASACTA